MHLLIYLTRSCRQNSVEVTVVNISEHGELVESRLEVLKSR